MGSRNVWIKVSHVTDTTRKNTLAKEMNALDLDKNKAKDALREWTAGGLKSLMQKTIRYGPQRVSLPAATAPDTEVPDGHAPDEVDAEDFLRLATLALMRHSGAMVPDLNIFTSGFESACKRLAVVWMLQQMWHPTL